MAKLRFNLDLSKRANKKLISTVNQAAGGRAVQENVHEIISNVEKHIQEYYSIHNLEFESGDGHVERNLVDVNDISTFILDLISERGLDPSTTVRVCIDGGGGFLKTCVSMFDPREEAEYNNEFSGSGV